MNILDIFIQFPILLFSIIIHECSHGYMAEHFGDDTARAMGRLTLNPLAHIDPVGTLLLPIACVLSHAPVFGWAKPVPVNPSLLYNPRKAMLFVALSGPASNLVLALLSGLLLGIGSRLVPPGQTQNLVFNIGSFAILINLYLFVFNLLPIIPLDGSKILSSILPVDLAIQFERTSSYGFIIIMALIMTGVLGKIMTPIVVTMFKVIVSMYL
ncbi:site-2 protease family protein [Elusimicrobiota bacterium]